MYNSSWFVYIYSYVFIINYSQDGVSIRYCRGESFYNKRKSKNTIWRYRFEVFATNAVRLM